jgi:hypothetical protein
MPEQYQGKYVFRCGTAGCIVMAYEERRKRKNGISGGLIARDRCKHSETPCPTTVIADEADAEILKGLGYELLYELDQRVFS